MEVLEQPSLRTQCELLDISRGCYYYQPCPASEVNLALMRRLDEPHLKHPVYGSRWLASGWEPGLTRTIVLVGAAGGLFAGGLGFVAARRALGRWVAVVGTVVAGSLLVARAAIAWMAVFDGRTKGVLNPLPMTVMLMISAIVAGYLYHAHKLDKAHHTVAS